MSTQQSSINIIIPFSETITLDTSTFSKAYNSRWGVTIAFQNDAGGQSHKAICNEHTFSVNVSNQPLQSSMVNLITLPVYGLTENEVKQIQNNKAYINIDSSSNKNVYDMVLCASKLLISFLNNDHALGFVDTSAQNYVPKRRLENSYMNKSTLDQSDLYQLFVSVQEIYDTNGIWMHTHGLEQFGLPNLELSFVNKDELSHYKMVVDSTAIYMLENGNILKPGDVIKLGDGHVYKISYRKDQDSPTGIITLQRK